MGKVDHLVATQWKPGVSANPAGRPRGARSKLHESVIAALYEDFSNHGTEAIARVRERQPAAYLAACVSLLPKQQEKMESPFVDLNDDELALLESFLKSTRAKTVTTIDATPEPQPARAATEKVDLTTLSDAEIEQRLEAAFYSSKRVLR